jgi:hypothetical protein
MLIAEAAVSTTSLSDVISQLSSVGTYLTEQVGNVFNIIQSYPIALIPVGITLLFVAVKFTKYILGI